VTGHFRVTRKRAGDSRPRIYKNDKARYDAANVWWRKRLARLTSERRDALDLLGAILRALAKETSGPVSRPAFAPLLEALRTALRDHLDARAVSDQVDAAHSADYPALGLGQPVGGFGMCNLIENRSNRRDGTGKWRTERAANLLEAILVAREGGPEATAFLRDQSRRELSSGTVRRPSGRVPRDIGRGCRVAVRARPTLSPPGILPVAGPRAESPLRPGCTPSACWVSPRLRSSSWA
jgi:hypothetical protein